MKLVSDFITFNYYHDYSNPKDQRTLEKTLMNIYCLHLKFLLKNINSILKTESVNNLVSEKISYNKNQLEITDG